ncbi:MAG: Asp-tRNA(Asn)/Glu-tRNA(Gln) amidotransferase subunit GatC [Nitrospinaceae bacterium]
MAHSEFDVERIAQLARLHLTAEEKERLSRQFEQILGYIDLLDRLDTQAVEPTSHVLPLQNVFREDRAEERFPGAPYLPLAPRQGKGHYEVPKIIG